jgi:hypothetical protein
VSTLFLGRRKLRNGPVLSRDIVRTGLPTEARRADHDAKTIAAQGGWKPNSATLYGYM